MWKETLGSNTHSHIYVHPLQQVLCNLQCKQSRLYQVNTKEFKNKKSLFLRIFGSLTSECIYSSGNRQFSPHSAKTIASLSIFLGIAAIQRHRTQLWVYSFILSILGKADRNGSAVSPHFPRRFHVSDNIAKAYREPVLNTNGVINLQPLNCVMTIYFMMMH